MAVTHQPLRIAHAITRLINGGADENTVISCNGAVRRGHSVMLVHGAETRTEILAAVDPRVEIVGLPSLVQPIAPLSDMRALRGLVATSPPPQARRRPHPHQQGGHPRASGCTGREGARPRARRAHRAVRQRRSSRAARVPHGGAVGPGDDARFHRRQPRDAGSVCPAGVGSPERHYVVPWGSTCPCSAMRPKPEDWRDLLRLQPDDPRPPIVVMLAVFEPRKRHLECLESFPSIVAGFPEVRLVFAGDGRLRGEIEARIRTHGLERNVVLTGFHPHPEQPTPLRNWPARVRARGAGAVPCKTSRAAGPRSRRTSPRSRGAAPWRERALVGSDLEDLADAVIAFSTIPRAPGLQARRQQTSRTGTRGEWASA